ncbi:MAG: hypothetical protein PHE55_08525 [Methylococcaceae bacterium]|nr:hypothetical protein [Methylococcaceae bacterium]
MAFYPIWVKPYATCLKLYAVHPAIGIDYVAVYVQEVELYPLDSNPGAIGPILRTDGAGDWHGILRIFGMDRLNSHPSAGWVE